MADEPRDAAAQADRTRPKAEELSAAEHGKLSALFARSGIPAKYVTVVFQFVRQHAAWRASSTEYIEAQRDSLRYRWLRASSLVQLAGDDLDARVDAGMKEDETARAERNRPARP